VTLDRHHSPSDSAEVSAQSRIGSDACLTLVRAARDGSPEAVGRLFELCGDRLLALIRLRLGRELRRQVESRDVLQNTLLKGFERIDRFQGSGRETLVGWLAAIACNEIRDQADRYRRLKRDGRAQVSLDSQIELRAPQVHSLTSALTLKAETSRLEAAIEELAEDHREVILLRQFEELSWAEVGQRLGRSEEAARKLFARAMAALTVRMTGRRPAD
jgi:RNA polymerase sigma-70 factor (ECF subfamily)